jgi:competence protein ComEC
MAMTRRPVVGMALAFGAGIIAEKFAGVPVWAWPAGAAVILIAGCLPVLRARSFGLVFLFVCACAGAMALRSYGSVPAEHVSRFTGRPEEMTLQCRAVSGVDHQMFGRQRRVRFIAEAQELTLSNGSRRVNGRVLVTIFREEPIVEGNEVLVSGRLRAVPSFGGRGRLSYKDTLLGQKVAAVFNVRKSGRCEVLRQPDMAFWVGWGYFCRRWLNGVYDRYLSPGEAGLMKGLITGDRKGIAEHVKEIFLRTGTSHILAVSGMNVAMVAYGIFFLLSLLPVPRAARMLAAIALTAWYAYVAGGSSPVVRSAVMSAVFLLGYVMEREQESLNTLAIAALAILVVNPTQLFDAGFQLSFVGVMSLILIGPLVAGLFPEGKHARVWNEYLGVSVAAFLGTAGITAYYFGTITPVSLAANIPAVPLVALITALGAVLLIVSGLPWLAVPVAVVLKASLNLFVGILYLFTLIPGGFFYCALMPSLAQAITYYVLLLILVYLARRSDRLNPLWSLGL